MKREACVLLGWLFLGCGSSEPTIGAQQSDPDNDASVVDSAPDGVAVNDVAPDGGNEAPDGGNEAPDGGNEAQDGGNEAQEESGVGEFVQRTYSGSEGSLDYLMYRPAGSSAKKLPLVVALHGCGQSVSDFVSTTALSKVADEAPFVVVWPQQSPVSNPWLCWNWFLTAHQRRDRGEAAVISAIVNEVVVEGGVQVSKIYALGLSAGGAMAVVLGTVFPDKFAAVGSIAGCPFKGISCINGLSALTGDELAVLAHEAMGTHARALPIFVVQGDADSEVVSLNGDRLVEQFLGVADLVDNGQMDRSISRSPVSEKLLTAPGGKTYVSSSYVGADGEELILRWTVHGLGHAWPGGSNGTFSDPTGPNASETSWMFFNQHELP